MPLPKSKFCNFVVGSANSCSEMIEVFFIFAIFYQILCYDVVLRICF